MRCESTQVHRSQPAGCVAHVGGGVRDQPHRSSESSARPGGVLSPGPLLQGHRNAGTPLPGVRGPSSSLRGTAWKPCCGQTESSPRRMRTAGPALLASGPDQHGRPSLLLESHFSRFLSLAFVVFEMNILPQGPHLATPTLPPAHTHTQEGSLDPSDHSPL